MSPSSVGNGPPSMSPSNHPPQQQQQQPQQQATGPNNNNSNNSSNNSNRDNNNTRNFSSPETPAASSGGHRPSSTNNDPLVSPHPLQQPQSFFPQQQPPSVASMRASSPSSPGSVKSVKQGGQASILERALASAIKQEVVSSSSTASMTNCIETSMANTAIGGHHLSQQPIDAWPHQQQQQPQQQQPQQQQQYADVLGSEVFMKPEIDTCNLDYDLHYGNPHGVHLGGVAPQGHHLVGPTRVSGGQEDHLHSPSQYSMATQQQPPWVR